MKYCLLAAVAVTAIAAPAQARDGQAYFGVEGGIMKPKSMDADALVDFTSTPALPAGPTDVAVDNAIDFDFDMGWDVDAIAGYDFGVFRVEAELGYKKADREFDVDEDFVAGLNTALNRPSGVGDPGAPGLPRK